MSIRKSKHLPTLAEGELSFIGSTQLTASQCGFNLFGKVIPQFEGTTAPAGMALTVAYSADKKIATIYAWKATNSSTTTLIAATASVDVGFIALGE